MKNEKPLKWLSKVRAGDIVVVKANLSSVIYYTVEVMKVDYDSNIHLDTGGIFNQFGKKVGSDGTIVVTSGKTPTLIKPTKKILKQAAHQARGDMLGRAVLMLRDYNSTRPKDIEEMDWFDIGAEIEFLQNVKRMLHEQHRWGARYAPGIFKIIE